MPLGNSKANVTRFILRWNSKEKFTEARLCAKELLKDCKAWGAVHRRHCDRRTQVKACDQAWPWNAVIPLNKRREYARDDMVWPARNTPNSQVWRTGREDYSVSMACLTQGASRYTKGEQDHVPVWPWVVGQNRLGQAHWVHQVWRNVWGLCSAPGYGNVTAQKEWVFREWISISHSCFVPILDLQRKQLSVLY